jgi:UDP-N-acetylmuramate dehydrogenase
LFYHIIEEKIATIHGGSHLSRESIYQELLKRFSSDRVKKNAAMKEFTSFRAGGSADLLVVPGSVEDLSETLKILTFHDMDALIMGNGTNLLVLDGGYRGAIVKIGQDLGQFETKNSLLIAGAGALLKDAAAEALSEGLGGIEFASGIPGSVGGAVFMNAGAYDGEMKGIVAFVSVMSSDGERIYELSNADMEYSYRKSVLMDNGGIVVSAGFSLESKDREAIRTRMEELSGKRREKQPWDVPSAGSFFKRPPGNYAGKLIEDAGLKGTSVGGASISNKHAGFLVNENNATAKDIIGLMRVVQEEVFRTSGVRLEPEIRIIGEE